MKVNSILIAISILFTCMFFACSDPEIPSVQFGGSLVETDSLNKTYNFRFSGLNPDLLSVYTGDPGRNFRYSALWMNSIEFKKHFDDNTDIAGVCIYQFEAPMGGTFDTLQIKKMEEDGIDAFYIQINSPYSGKAYHRRFNDETFDPLTMDTVTVFAGSEYSGIENKLKKYDEGLNVMTKYKFLDYQYTYAGKFEAFAVATNMSDKKYYGDGYISSRFSSVDEYGVLRQITRFDVTVGIELKIDTVSKFTNAFQIAIRVPVELKAKAMNLAKEDFELREAETNKVVTITGVINQMKNMGWYGVQAKYNKGKKYKLRPVKSFYGDYLEILIP
jgi:hypothetical protein